MKISQINNFEYTFGTKKGFKRMFDKCSYSNEPFYPWDTSTIEHIIPESCGGQDDYANYLVVKRSWNMERSSKPLDEFIKEYPEVKENIKNAVNSKEGQIIEGINWAEEVKKTLFKAIGYDIFAE